jgi:hypothetical protein
MFDGRCGDEPEREIINRSWCQPCRCDMTYRAAQQMYSDIHRMMVLPRPRSPLFSGYWRRQLLDTEPPGAPAATPWSCVTSRGAPPSFVSPDSGDHISRRDSQQPL